MGNKSIRVVILRPQTQAQSLAQALQAIEGAGEIEILPMLEILPTVPEQTELDSFRQSAFVIVSSVNAINHLPISELKVLQNKAIVTLGEATAQAVRARGLEVFYTGPSGTTSEVLLRQLFLQTSTIQGKRIGLLAGWGGRTLLAQTLAERGAKIAWLRVYRSEIPKIDFRPILNRYQQDDRQTCFIASSSQILSHFYTLIPSDYLAWVQEMPIIVVSDRVGLQAREYGFKRVFNAHGADKTAIAEALKKVGCLPF